MSDEIDRTDIAGALQPLGKGGQAKVYSVEGLTLHDVPGQVVFKEYKKGQVSPHGLRSIVSVRSKMDVTDRAELDALTAWPCRLVRHGPDVCGVLMPRIHESFFQQRILPSGKSVNDPREVQNMFVDPGLAERLGMPLLSLVDRLTICRDLARALSFLHANELVFGDINARNELFRVGQDPAVMLVDCDAARKVGSAAVVRQLSAPDWDPPEGGTALSSKTDVYKLGLFVLRTLSPGPMASTARDPSRADDLLEGDGPTMLRRATSKVAKERPSAAEWQAYLTTQVDLQRSAQSRPAGRPSTTVRAAAGPTAAPGVTSLRPAKSTSGWRRDPATGKLVPND